MEAKGIELDKQSFYIIGYDWEQIMADIHRIVPSCLALFSVLYWLLKAHDNPSLAESQYTVIIPILHTGKLRQDVAAKCPRSYRQDGQSQDPMRAFWFQTVLKASSLGAEYSILNDIREKLFLTDSWIVEDFNMHPRCWNIWVKINKEWRKIF